jgi:hypothetical protein
MAEQQGYGMASSPASYMQSVLQYVGSITGNMVKNAKLEYDVRRSDREDLRKEKNAFNDRNLRATSIEHQYEIAKGGLALQRNYQEEIGIPLGRKNIEKTDTEITFNRNKMNYIMTAQDRENLRNTNAGVQIQSDKESTANEQYRAWENRFGFLGTATGQGAAPKATPYKTQSEIDRELIEGRY